jgi:hypothetical protein
LLSPEGWKKVAPLLDQSIAYPADSIIRILWTPRFIGEDWIKGNRAQVESKWIDYYGSLDSKLQYHPGDVCTLVIQYDLVFTNTYIKVGANGLQEEVKGATEWKLRWPNERSGTIEQVIAYLEKRRESTRDSIMRRNASRSISSLQNLLRRRGRGRGASAC